MKQYFVFFLQVGGGNNIRKGTRENGKIEETIKDEQLLFLKSVKLKYISYFSYHALYLEMLFNLVNLQKLGCVCNTFSARKFRIVLCNFVKLHT